MSAWHGRTPASTRYIATGAAVRAARSSRTSAPRSRAASPERRGERSSGAIRAFMYHGIVCGMAAFKQHVTFGFWKGQADPRHEGPDRGRGHGPVRPHRRRVKDLPAKREHRRLREEGDGAERVGYGGEARGQAKEAARCPMPAVLQGRTRRRRRAGASGLRGAVAERASATTSSGSPRRRRTPRATGASPPRWPSGSPRASDRNWKYERR